MQSHRPYASALLVGRPYSRQAEPCAGAGRCSNRACNDVEFGEMGLIYVAMCTSKTAGDLACMQKRAV